MGDVPAVFTILLSVAGGWAVLTGETPVHELAPSAPASANVSSNTKEDIVLQRGPDGYFYADAKVNGVAVRFLVDTGANTTVLLRKDADRARLPSLETVPLRTAGRLVDATQSQIQTLEIGTSTLDNMPAVIIDGGPRTSLIGMNALTRLGSIKLHGNELVLD